jgi:hypothetical protein
MSVLGETADLDFPRVQKRKTAVLPYNGYSVTDAVGLKERLMNQGQAAKIKIAARINTELREDMEDQFCEQLFIDGNTAGNTGRIHGFDSCFSVSGVRSSGYVGEPNDTYAGLSTALGVLGSWEDSTWPKSRGETGYHWWSPIRADATDSNWPASTDNFQNNVLYIIRQLRIWQMNRGQKLRTMLFEGSLYADFLNALESRDRIDTQRGSDNSLLVKLGFGDVMNYDGVECTHEQGVPANTVYGFDPDQIQLRTLNKGASRTADGKNSGLFFVPDVDWSLETLSERYAVIFYGNMRLNPKAMVAIDADGF